MAVHDQVPKTLSKKFVDDEVRKMNVEHNGYMLSKT
jgi:hypothetical protein